MGNALPYAENVSVGLFENYIIRSPLTPRRGRTRGRPSPWGEGWGLREWFDGSAKYEFFQTTPKSNKIIQLCIEAAYGEGQ